MSERSRSSGRRRPLTRNAGCCGREVASQVRSRLDRTEGRPGPKRRGIWGFPSRRGKAIRRTRSNGSAARWNAPDSASVRKWGPEGPSHAGWGLRTKPPRDHQRSLQGITAGTNNESRLAESPGVLRGGPSRRDSVPPDLAARTELVSDLVDPESDRAGSAPGWPPIGRGILRSASTAVDGRSIAIAPTPRLT